MSRTYSSLCSASARAAGSIWSGSTSSSAGGAVPVAMNSASLRAIISAISTWVNVKRCLVRSHAQSTSFPRCSTNRRFSPLWSSLVAVVISMRVMRGGSADL